jgi:hypothetical protein
LLGLKVSEGALAGLDGVLIGLRTRELLQQLLEARCKLSPVLMLIEDLHWIDSASEELLRKIVNSESKLRLLLVHTRRSEYAPRWLNHTRVTGLRLEPLPSGDIRGLVQARLGAETLPEALVRQVAEKAEGNPLFAEEIVSFLLERGIPHAEHGKLDSDTRALAAALPASVQSVLIARVDRLVPMDRVLLQAASVIGRSFDAELLAAVVSETDVSTRLEAIQALDLIGPEVRTDEYVFKHALVRDALYQSLLTKCPQALHLKIAEEIERRSGNRLTEVAEILAHHYSQTDQADKAFTYLSLAGSKSLGVYSFDEAATYLTAALAALDTNPACASDEQVAEFLLPYTALLTMNTEANVIVDVFERHSSRIGSLNDDPRVVRIRFHYLIALLWIPRYRDAVAVQRQTSLMAECLGDSRSKAYALVGEMWVSTMVAHKPLHEFEKLKRDAIKAASDTTDSHIQNWTRWAIGWEEAHRGRMSEARDSAFQLMKAGEQLNDPRFFGSAVTLLSYIATFSESYAEALDYSEQTLAVAITPHERHEALMHKCAALIILRRTEEGAVILEEFRRRCATVGIHPC